MSKKSIIILVIAIILVVASIVFYVFCLNYNNSKRPVENLIQENVVLEEESKTEDLENVKYSDFVFYKEDKTEVNFSDYKDKPTMILFWNPNNEDSVEDLKKVDGLYEKYKDTINFIMLCTAEEASEEIKNEVSIELFYDLYKDAQIKYDVTDVPTLIYITADNEIFNAKVGFTTTDALEANLDIISNNI